MQTAFNRLRAEEKKEVVVALESLRLTQFFGFIKEEVCNDAIGVMRAYAHDSVTSSQIKEAAIKLALCESLLDEFEAIAKNIKE